MNDHAVDNHPCRGYRDFAGADGAIFNRRKDRKMTDKLLPCPNLWCNGVARLIKLDDIEINGKIENNHYVSCMKCHNNGPVFLTCEEAVVAWNTRADHFVEPNEKVWHGKKKKPSSDEKYVVYEYEYSDEGLTDFACIRWNSLKDAWFEITILKWAYLDDLIALSSRPTGDVQILIDRIKLYADTGFWKEIFDDKSVLSEQEAENLSKGALDDLARYEASKKIHQDGVERSTHERSDKGASVSDEAPVQGDVNILIDWIDSTEKDLKEILKKEKSIGIIFILNSIEHIKSQFEASKGKTVGDKGEIKDFTVGLQQDYLILKEKEAALRQRVKGVEEVSKKTVELIMEWTIHGKDWKRDYNTGTMEVELVEQLTQFKAALEGKAVEDKTKTKKVRCNFCSWEGDEDDLERDMDGYPNCVCPRCLKDEALMDLNENELGLVNAEIDVSKEENAALRQRVKDLKDLTKLLANDLDAAYEKICELTQIPYRGRAVSVQKAFDLLEALEGKEGAV